MKSDIETSIIPLKKKLMYLLPNSITSLSILFAFLSMTSSIN